MNHGIILHEEYRERMKKFSPERLGNLVLNMFRVDDGEEPISFPDDEALDVFSEVVCSRLVRDIQMSEKQRNNRLGKTKEEPKKTKKNQKKPNDNQKEPLLPITNNQLPITNKPIKDIYGEAKNVLLTKEEYQKIKDKGLTDLIEELSLYMASKKKTYADHYMTILAWGRRREKENKVVPLSGQDAKNQFNRFKQRDDYDIAELERKLIRN